MPSFGMCSHCLQTLNLANGRPTSPVNRILFQLASRNRGTNGRQMSWLPRIFRITQSNSPTPPMSADTQSTPSSSSLSHIPAPERILTAALQEAAEIRRKEKEAEIKKIEDQLIAYGESEPIDTSTPKSFQDPLGHLTFDEQIQYLANPPPEYLQGLQERAHKREEFDKTMYTADPINQWHLCYSSKPNFAKDILPPWVPWTEDKRIEVMEKFRRYDERFQSRLQSIYKSFDSEDVRQGLKRAITMRLRKDIQKETIASSKKYKKYKKDDPPQMVQPNVEDPPLAVLDVKVYREMIQMRNLALKKAQAKFMEEVSVFEDINESGVLASVEKQGNLSRILWQRKREVMQQKEALQEWSNMSTDLKVESVNWGAINSEA